MTTIKGSDADPTKAFEEFAEKWDGEMTSALGKLTDRANTYFDDFDAVREARNRIAQADANMTNDVAASFSRDEIEQIISDRIATLKPIATEPNLRVARIAMKPTGDGVAVPAMIANDGGTDAVVVSAQFVPTPDSQFKTGTEVEPDVDEVVIKFEPHHNNPSKAGHHKLYTRMYLLPEQGVAANRTVKISVEISNNEHLGWGMEGELELKYQDGKTLTIPAVRAMFVEEIVETT